MYDFDGYLDRLTEQHLEDLDICPHCEGACYDTDEQECYLCEGLGEVSPMLKRQYLKEKKDETNKEPDFS